jgi:hypothetical protein
MSNSFPHEIIINGVYFSPLLLVFILAFLATIITTAILNKMKISQYFLHIPLAFVSILTLYIVFIDTFFIKI